MPSLNRTVGALSFPLSDTDDTDFASLDPARDILLELIAAAINDELGPRWVDATAGSTITSPTPVAQVFPHEPTDEVLQQMKVEFPALFVYRDSANPVKEEEFTLHQNKYTSRWGVDYFLGPLDIGERGKLGDILQAVGKLIGQVVRVGGHKSYSTTTLPSGQTRPTPVLGPWGPGTCGFSQVHVTEFQAGPAQLSREAPKYWACASVLETTELDGISENAFLDYYDGAQLSLGVANSEGEIDNVIVADTDTALNIWDP